MPTSTRSGNKKTDFGVYYSKKIPKQTYFAHRRKFVKRPGGDDVPEKRQVTFLPAELRRRGTVQDSEGEGEVENEDLDVEGEGRVVIGVETQEVVGRDRTRSKQRRKRTSDVIQEEGDEEAANSTPKRRKKAPAASKKKPPRSKAKDSASPEFEEEKKRRQKRQSTMTQMVDGRRPEPGSKEPEFKPAKKTARRSWGGRGNKPQKDAKQRTLTQMVPGINRSFEVYSDSGEDEEEADKEAEEAEKRENQAYDVVLTQRLIAQGLLQLVDDSVEVGEVQEELCVEATVGHGEDQHEDGKSSLPLPDVDDDVTEDEYLPTQFIKAPVAKTTRSSRRLSGRQQQSPGSKNNTADVQPSQPKTKKSRFSLLSTPERRRVREIPSSQSPAESIISIQNTPHRSGQYIRSPLTRRSNNALTTAVAETPSKRNKQVTFQESDKEQHPPRRTLKRFASTILDSEDEDNNDLEIEDVYGVGNENIGAETQALIRKMDVSPAKGVNIGEETQADLELIDRACADGKAGDVSGGEMEELDVAMAENRASPQRGEKPSTTIHEPVERPRKTPPPHPTRSHTIKQESLDSPATWRTSPLRTPPRAQKTIIPSPETPSPPYSTARAYIKRELSAPSTPPSHQPSYTKGLEIIKDTPTNMRQISPPLAEQVTPSQHHRTRLQDTYPSSPMFINDSDNETDEEAPASTPPLNQHYKSTHPTPATQNEAYEEESQLSNQHSLAADHQLRTEYASYSQFPLPLPHPPTSATTTTAPPFPSSMFVAPESGPLYQQSPFPPKPQPLFPPPPSQREGPNSHVAASQATTVDPTQSQPHSPPQTFQQSRSDNENDNDLPFVPDTPHSHSPEKDAYTPSSSSPPRPPPLLIPSSFPSPNKVNMHNILCNSSPHSQTHAHRDAAADDDDDDDDDDDQDYSPTIARGDGVGASGIGKGYTQWLAGGDEDGMQSYGYGYGSYEDFSIPAPPPGMHGGASEEDEGEDEDDGA